MKGVDVINYNSLVHYNTLKEALDFYLRCMCASEGSERDRYTNIYLTLKMSSEKSAHNRFNGEILAHDNSDSSEIPLIYSIGKYDSKKGYVVDKIKLDEPITYEIYKKKYKEKDYANRF